MTSDGSFADPCSDLDQLRTGVSIATARHARLSLRQHDYLRQKSAQCIDEYFFKILAACEVTEFVECGAYDAATSVRFLRAGGRKAIAIEANPNTYSAMTRLAQEHGVVTVNCGLGSEVAETEFFIPKSDSHAGNASFLRKPGENPYAVKVSVDTIDNIVEKHIEPRCFIALWVDVEGLALDVLKGGTAVLKGKNCRVVKVEVETKRFWQGQALASEVHRFLSRFRYRAVLRDIEYANQYNLIYVREELVDGMEEILMQCWRELANLEFDWADRRRAVRDHLAVLKRRLTLTGGETSRASMFLHRCAALLGSKSSAEFLHNSRLRRRRDSVTEP
jgi:FkbM family methyltransferase